jgi:glycosyltransferase involved in cell wall biosynthesis
LRVAFVQTYPIYHDGVDTEEWLSLYGREIGMAASLARTGHDVEFWAVGEREETVDIPRIGGAPFSLRIFPPRRFGGRSRDHWSPALLARARSFRADLHVLNGLNGGAGIRLLREHAVPVGAAFSFILGGGHFSRFVPRAAGIFYQSAQQRLWLERPGLRIWRRAVLPERLIFLPRTVDTALFSPGPDVRKEWDVLVACRLIDRLKNLSVLGPLGRRFRVAVAGSGPDEASLRRRFPNVTWLGRIPHQSLPRLFRASRLFMHTGVREILPRVITEAMSCGIPAIAFAGLVTSNVLPRGCGLLVPAKGFLEPIEALLGDEDARHTMGRLAREYALAHLNPSCFETPLREMMTGLES